MQHNSYILEKAYEVARHIKQKADPRDRFCLVGLVVDTSEDAAEERYQSFFRTEVSIDREVNEDTYFLSLKEYDYFSSLKFVDVITECRLYEGLSNSKPDCKECIRTRVLINLSYPSAFVDKFPVFSCCYGLQSKLSGAFVAVIDIPKISSYLACEKYQDKLSYEQETGTIRFLDSLLTLEGKMERQMFELLYQNLNSVVDKKAMYDHVYKGSYEIVVKHKGKTKMHESMEKMFVGIKKKIKSSPLNNDIFLVQDEGFGIFLRNQT